MEKFEKIDNEFYASKYGIPRVGDPNEIWKKIKDNRELLNWSIKKTKDKFGERDLVNGLAICDSILVDYNGVDKDIYQELVNLIYSNEQIARIVQDGYNNGGFSYLLMTLWNPNLKLTDEQKAFAVDEAMNKMGTVRYENAMNEYSKKLDEKGFLGNLKADSFDERVKKIIKKNDVASLLYSITYGHGFVKREIDIYKKMI